MKFDWSKLTSRKFWIAVATFAGMLAMYSGADATEAEKIVALIMAGAAVIAYIVGEGLTDKARAGAPTTIITTAPPDEEGGAESGDNG